MLAFGLSALIIEANELEYMDASFVALLSGIGHLVIASMTGVQKKMNLPENSEAHLKSFQDFDSFCRKLENHLKLPEEDRSAVPKYVFTTMEHYETLISSSPMIPTKILRSFRHWASRDLRIELPSIVKTFFPIHRKQHCENSSQTNDTCTMFHTVKEKQISKKMGKKYMKDIYEIPSIDKDMKRETDSFRQKRIKRKNRLRNKTSFRGVANEIIHKKNEHSLSDVSTKSETTESIDNDIEDLDSRNESLPSTEEPVPITNTQNLNNP